MSTCPSATFHLAATLQDALDALADSGSSGRPIAGGTWIMRAPVRHEAIDKAYIGISRIADLRSVVVTDETVEIGAVVTHAALETALRPHADLAGLADAAGRSANPGVRGLATIGGNLATSAFAAADLVPALLALDARVELLSRTSRDELQLADFLRVRADMPVGSLLTRVIFPRRTIRSAHARLPMRKAGDYPAAIVSLVIECDAADCVVRARVAVGSVEAVARRWTALEEALCGRPLDPVSAHMLAGDLANDFTGRDGVDAPGWYRVSVLPTLIRRAVTAALAGSPPISR